MSVLVHFHSQQPDIHTNSFLVHSPFVPKPRKVLSKIERMERLLSSSVKLTRKLLESNTTIIRSFNHSRPYNTFHSLLTKPPKTHSYFQSVSAINGMKTLLLRRRIPLVDSNGIAFQKTIQFSKQNLGNNPRFLSSQGTSRYNYLLRFYI